MANIYLWSGMPSLGKMLAPVLVLSLLLAPATPVFAQEAGTSSEILSPETPTETPVQETPVLEFDATVPAEGTLTDTPREPSQSAAQESLDSGGETLNSESSDPNTDPTVPNPTFTYQSLSPQLDKTTGALTQRIDLPIPPGRNGLQPDLALVYNNHRAEDSIVGYGWSLSIPYIERLNRMGSDKLYTKDYFSSSLGGELATTTTTGEYRHKTEDGRFLKYTYSTTTNSWTVYDKKGTRYLFGSSTQAQQYAAATSSNVYRWMIEEIRDTNDNYIEYTYARDGDQLYPSQITYTGSGSTDGVMSIDFTRSSRPDPYVSYKSAFEVTTSYRITQITASVNGQWVRKYSLAYTNGHNGYRSLLSAVYPRGRDGDGTELSTPGTTFEYSSTSVTFAQNNQSAFPGQAKNVAHIPADINGDGLTDLSVFYTNSTDGIKKELLNTNRYTSAYGTEINSNAPFTWSRNENGVQSYIPEENGVRFVDVNGDWKVDLVRGMRNSDGTNDKNLYLNQYASTTGYSWSAAASTSTIPIFGYADGVNQITTGFFGNVNGDGLIDYVLSVPVLGGSDHGTYFGNGNGWDSATSTIFNPKFYITTPSSGNTYNSLLVDVNGDGLDDWSYNDSGTKFSLNTGVGWESSYHSGWNISTSTINNGYDRGIRFIDINGDGLVDYLRSYNVATSSAPAGAEIGTYNYVFLNTGSGWATSSISLPTANYITYSDSGYLLHNEYYDWNGDGIADAGSYENQAKKQDLLKTVNLPTGGFKTFEYKPVHQYLGANATLPFPIHALSRTITNDGNGNAEEINYSYSGGKVYIRNPYDRQFAGFASTTETRSEAIVKTYFNQGDGLDTATSEQTDSAYQLQRSYREDIFATATPSLVRRTFYKWETTDQGQDRGFAYLTKEFKQDYEGGETHKDSAIEYTYSTTTGDLTQILYRGEVTGSSDGTYSDTGSDSRTKVISYAASTTVNMSVPSTETINNHSSTKVKETKFYYDSLAHGSVSIGNVTKQEDWITGSQYASSTKTYNSYGLPTAETDRRGKSTSYTYDTYNFYVATSTNPLSQSTGFAYDYATGKVRQKIDPNGSIQQSIYDPVGRLKEEKMLDPLSPSNLVSKTQIVYTDATSTPSTQRTDYLSSATSTDLYTYLDGLGRPIQERREAEGSNTYAVRDLVYNGIGTLGMESLPYFASSTSKTAATTTTALYTRYTYDTLKRVATTTNSIGSTLNIYSPRTTRTKDARGKYKELISDAYGNLIQVNEFNSGSVYTTVYTYDALNNLTKITDAESISSNPYSTDLERDSIQYFSISDASQTGLDLGSTFTLSAWIQVESDISSAGDFRTILGRSGGAYILWYSNEGGTRRFQLYNEDGSTGVASKFDTTLTTGTWYHILVTRNGNNPANFWLNGVKTTGTGSLQANTKNDTGSFLIGNQGSANNWDGKIDDVRIWSRVLSDGEIADIYAGSSSNGANLQGWWKFDNDATDSWVNGNNLTGTGSPTYSDDVPETGSSISNIRNFTYDGMSRRLTAEDLHASNDGTYGTWTYTYDDNGNISTQTDPKSQVVSYTYDDLSRVLTEDYSGQAGIEITYTYDNCSYAKGRLCTASSTDARMAYAYSILGNISSASTTISGTGYTSTYTYDRQGNTTNIVYPDNREVSYGYNSAGMLDSASTKASGVSNFTPVVSNVEYDPRGMASYKEFQNGLKTTLQYDSSAMYRLSRLYTGTTSPPALNGSSNTHSTDLERDSSQYFSISDASQTGLDLGSTFTISAWIKLESDIGSAGDFRTIVGRSGGAYILWYSNEGGTKRFQLYNEDGSTGVSSKYDVNLSTGTWYHILVTRNGNNPANFWLNGAKTTGTGNLQATTKNDTGSFLIGNQGSANNWDGQIDDVRIWTRVLSDTEIGDIYNQAGSSGNGSNLVGWWKLDNDATDASGNSNTLTGASSPTYTTDVPFSNFAGGGQASLGVQDISYTYDENGNITALTDRSATYALKTVYFTYDDLNRMLTASTSVATSTSYKETFTYGRTGNIASKATSTTFTYTYAGTGYVNPHAVTQIANGLGTTTYAYDNNGNLTDAGIWDYTWNYRNRLTQAGNGTATTTYGYNHADERMIETTGSTTVWYPTKLQSVSSLTDGATTTATTTSYIFAGNELVATVESVTINGSATGTPTTRYIYPDHLSSTNVVADGSGSVTQTLDYYPYGAQRINSGSDVSERQFIGQFYDSNTSLSYLNARYYEGLRGQFLSQDPTFLTLGDETRFQNLVGLSQDQILSDPQQLNSYSYGRNNPIRFKDPKGLYIESGFDVAMLALSFNSFRQDPSFLNAAGVVLDAGSLAFPGIPAVGGLALRAGKAADATYSVYQGVDSAGVVRYVGITGRDPAVRIGEHLQSIGTGKEALEYRVINGTGNLSRDQARIMEQSLINTNGLQKNGGTLLNKINSISPSSQLYKSVPNVSAGGGGSGGGGGGIVGVLNSLSSALKQLSSTLSSFKK